MEEERNYGLKRVSLYIELDEKAIKDINAGYAHTVGNSDFIIMDRGAFDKIDFSESWVHLRKSNTEPIIRIYTEAKSQYEADTLADKFIEEIGTFAKS